MITEIKLSHQIISFEKIPVTIFNEADDACKTVADEIAELIRAKNKRVNTQYWDWPPAQLLKRYIKS